MLQVALVAFKRVLVEDAVLPRSSVENPGVVPVDQTGRSLKLVDSVAGAEPAGGAD
jgi:hypothetical protein